MEYGRDNPPGRFESVHHMNGQETCTLSISHTRAIIRLPLVMMKATIGSIVARINT